MNLRTICYRAFCETCLEVVSPAPRMTEQAAESDFAAHMNIQHAEHLESNRSANGAVS